VTVVEKLVTSKKIVSVNAQSAAKLDTIQKTAHKSRKLRRTSLQHNK
jgi:hypothetical protein